MSPLRERHERVRRVRLVQEKKRQMAEWALARAQEEEERLREVEIELLETLGAQSLMQGLFLEGKAAALRRNDLHLRDAGLAREAARGHLDEAARAEKRLERAEGEAGRLRRAGEEAAALATLLDEHLSAASFE